jgi:carbonic anhydrase/acetyltransferase-like protein (isoleucine patch superfamily)
MVAAGSLVRQNAKIPSGEVWAGNSTKILRKLTDEEIEFTISFKLSKFSKNAYMRKYTKL